MRLQKYETQQEILGDRNSYSKTDPGVTFMRGTIEAKGCEGCPLKETCTKAQGDREITVSLKYIRYKQQAREKLRSKEGHALSVRRMVEPESVFGQIKNNRGFRRFLLRGLHKVNLEVGWLSLAHNLLKKAANDQNRSHSGAGITS